MFRDYLPILIMLIFSAGFAAVALGLSWVLSPRRPHPVKDGTYECGVDPVGDARVRHSIRFYVVAMLFIVFDLETVFLYPWAITYRKLGLFGLLEMLVFLAILGVGYVYVWKRGALDWSGEARAAAIPRVGTGLERTTGINGGRGAGPAELAVAGAAHEWSDPVESAR